MSQDVFKSTCWYRGLTLEERAASLQRRRGGARRAPVDLGLARSEPIDHELAQRELAAWRAQAPFDRDEWFARRLALAGVDEGELGEILGEPIENVAARALRPPAWLVEMETAYRRSPRCLADVCRSSRLDPSVLGMLDCLEPLIRNGRERLDMRIEDLAQRARGAPFDPARAGDLFLDRLLIGLHAQLERVFVLELNVARMQNELEGATAAERFESFARRLREPDNALSLLAEYPFLARRAVEIVGTWERASFEVLEHLCADWTNLWAAFSPERDPGPIVRILGGAGDVHRAGRSVSIVVFESGLRLVHKPRSLAIDARFQELLARLNELFCAPMPESSSATASDTSRAIGGEHASRTGVLPRFRTLRVLDRRDHGWVEFVARSSCTSRDEVQRFYRRQGAYLALLHALEAVDVHFENLIAAGEHPVLVDLETLFHPRLPDADTKDPDSSLVRDATSRSVLRTGLLPNRSWSDGERGGIDVSGLGGEAGQLVPDALLHWESAGTDEMRAARKEAALPTGANLPTIGGDAVSALEFLEDIELGYRELSRVLLRHRAELLATIRSFARDEVRVVLRPTRAYGLLLSETAHPDFQRDALELERFLDKLWVGVEEAPHLARVIGAEHLDLLNGDVPFFATRPGSTDLSDSRGACIAQLLPRSGLALVEERLRALGESDVERQIWFIRSAFATAAVDPDRLRWPSYRALDSETKLEITDAAEAARSSREPERAGATMSRAPSGPRVDLSPPPRLRESLIERARTIGDRLESLALHDSAGHAAWIGFKFEAERWQLVALPDDLYSGILGVVHFLAHLGHVTQEERYTELARAALTPLRVRVREGRTNLGPIGAFNGLAGIVHCFAQWGRLWSDDELTSEARRIAELALERISTDEDLDVIGGSAGLIGVLTGMQRASPSKLWLEIATRCADHLLERARHMPVGVGWSTRIEKNQPAVGFSHGASGIAWALMRLHALTGDARHREIAERAIAYESTQFDPAERNWLDPGGQLKNRRTEDATLMVAWCYGAPGVGLARLDMLAAESVRSSGAALAASDFRERLQRDLDVAVATTRERGFGRNHSLCHGDLGNLELLARAARAAGNAELAQFVHRQTDRVLASLERDGALCGMPLGIESVALMNGLAGIGFGLLRLAEPERVPSVLTLDA